MRKKLLPLFALLGVFMFSGVGLAQGSFTMEIQISEQASVNLINYQVDLVFNTQALIAAGKMKTDGSDIRFFLDTCQNTAIPYWIESGINTTSTRVWVKVPSIPANSVKSIYMTYGDPLATSVSNFAATFPLAIISNGGPLSLTGTITTDWFQLDAGDVLTIINGSPLVINARKILINGTVDGIGAGYAGGAATGQAGFGPGGGTTSNPLNSGCGGGSYGGVGGTGGFDAGDTPGVGGPVYGTDSGTDSDMGSGGGASDLSFGGNGGGSLVMNAEYLTITGTINMDGESGQQPGTGRGAGGGSGGSVVSMGREVVFSGAITANGGSGSIGTSTANDDGGSGSGGRIKFFYTGTISNSGTTSVVGGPVGTNGLGGPPTVGEPGSVFEGELNTPENLSVSNGPESTPIDCSASIDETELTQVFEVFPNPVTDELFVKIGQANEMPTDLKITDMSGKIVFSQSNFHTLAEQMIDVSVLQAGSYFVELSNSSERSRYMIVKN